MASEEEVPSLQETRRRFLVSCCHAINFEDVAHHYAVHDCHRNERCKSEVDKGVRRDVDVDVGDGVAAEDIAADYCSHYNKYDGETDYKPYDKLDRSSTLTRSANCGFGGIPIE